MLRTSGDRTIRAGTCRERLVKTCLYTLTPDRDFIIDRVPGEEHVHFAVGCGHAFKFPTQIGRMFADLALDGTTPHDLTLGRSTVPS